jgi:hypothetical protein
VANCRAGDVRCLRLASLEGKTMRCLSSAQTVSAPSSPYWIKLRWFPDRLLQPRFVPVPISKTKREKPLNHKLLSLSAA